MSFLAIWGICNGAIVFPCAMVEFKQLHPLGY